MPARDSAASGGTTEGFHDACHPAGQIDFPQLYSDDKESHRCDTQVSRHGRHLANITTQGMLSIKERRYFAMAILFFSGG